MCGALRVFPAGSAAPEGPRNSKGKSKGKGKGAGNSNSYRNNDEAEAAQIPGYL